MIYLATDRDLPWDNIIPHSEFDWNLPKRVQLDLETKGFDAFMNDIVALQIGYGGDAYVIDPVGLDWSKAKALESCTCLGHNIKFDLRFLLVKGIQITRVWDTFLAEQLLTNGLSYKRGLGAVASRYLGESLDKDLYKAIIRVGLRSRSVIEYSGKDVLYLEKIARQQWDRLKLKGLDVVARDEMATLPAYVYMEHCGMLIDQDKWKAAEKLGAKLVEEKLAELNNKVIEDFPDYQDGQLDLFSDAPKVKLNWNSPQQVLNLFQKYEVLESDATSVSADSLSGIEHPVVELYLEYKKTVKLVSTYGSKFLRHVNPKTGRLHTSYKQILRSGRTSSSPNIQNIPSLKVDNPEDNLYRAAFKPAEGNIFIVADYSGQESVILADRSKEPNLLKFYKEGGADLHSYVARLVWPDELGDLELPEIKKNHPHLRQTAKSTTFSLAYGASAKSVGEEVYERFMGTFPGLFDYFDEQEHLALDRGYVLINEITGRKWYTKDMDKFWEYDRLMDSMWWAEYRKAKGERKEEMTKIKETYFALSGAIRRRAMNAPIQGTAAEQKKRAIREIFQFIRNNNLIGVVKIIGEVHDEIIIECPKEMAEELAPVVQDKMESAANYYLEELTMKATPVISELWTH